MTSQKTTLFVLLIMIIFSSCKENVSEEKTQTDLALNETLIDVSNIKEPSQAFKDYWYAGEAEITSYSLEQARYGEIREGYAVLIYVTEDFHAKKQVKADRTYPDNTSVLKLNATKKFNTGIYPYSIMQSTFYPVSNDRHAIKVSSSMQEWCGHVYAQLNNRETFEVNSHSYFESEADQTLKLEKSILENELWTQLRIDPSSLPQGKINAVPSFEFLRLKHKTFKVYEAIATLTNISYTLEYPELNRMLVINFDSNFPHTINSWEESFSSGFGKNAKTLTTKATQLKTIKSPYWSKNSNSDENLRKTLELEN